MSSLDYYDPLQLSSWHHFAYRAASARVDDLRGALVGYVERADHRPLEAFVLRHRDDHRERLCSPRVMLSAEEIERVLAGWQSARAALGEWAGELVRLLPEVRRSLEAAGGSVARCLWDAVSMPEQSLGYLADLTQYGAPAQLLAERRRECIDRFDRLARGILPPAAEVPDGFRWLFELSLELCLLDPFQENVGLWRLYDIGLDPPGPIGRPLVDHAFAEDKEPIAYGLEGGGVSVVGADEAARRAAELRAFEPAPERVRAHAGARLRADLEEEGAWDEEAWDELVEQQDVPVYEIDDVALAVGLLERQWPERLAAAVGELREEWAETCDRLASALDETDRGTCVLLQWTSKDPAL